MFSKEESKTTRYQVWTSFGKSFRRKCTLNKTGIKGMSFKFHFDTKTALVALDLEVNPYPTTECWKNLLALKSIHKTDYILSAIYNKSYDLNSEKKSRIYVTCDKKVSIHNKAT